jgi:hypothetical protein
VGEKDWGREVKSLKFKIKKEVQKFEGSKVQEFEGSRVSGLWWLSVLRHYHDK